MIIRSNLLNQSKTRGFLLLGLISTSYFGIAGATNLGLASIGYPIKQSITSHSSQSLQIAQKKDTEVTLVSFAVTKAAHDAIIPKFVAKWQKEQNQTVRFKQSYGGSGSQTRAVIDGLPADIVHLALASDTEKLVKAKLIVPGWQSRVSNQGIVSKSVVTIVVRQGNPKGIKAWEDLAKSGVKVITADPKTSGVAKWNFLALWNAGLASGGETKAKQFVTNVFKNVPILAKDARDATDIFYRQGQGDALLNYENEILLADQKIADLPYITPTNNNISIDNPIAVVDRNVEKHRVKTIAEAFVRFLYTPEAQREFAKAGFRPVNSTVSKEFASKFPKITKLATIDSFGGWDAAERKFFANGALFDQIQKQIR